MLSKKDKLTLETAMQNYLQLKALTATQERQMDALKDQILQVASSYRDDFVDGALTLEGVGVIKEAFNKPKVVHTKSGESLNAIELVGLLAELGEGFAQPAINITKLRDEVKKGNKAVLQVLKKHKVSCVQDERLDIKKL